MASTFDFLKTALRRSQSWPALFEAALPSKTRDFLRSACGGSEASAAATRLVDRFRRPATSSTQARNHGRGACTLIRNVRNIEQNLESWPWREVDQLGSERGSWPQTGAAAAECHRRPREREGLNYCILRSMSLTLRFARSHIVTGCVSTAQRLPPSVRSAKSWTRASQGHSDVELCRHATCPTDLLSARTCLLDIN